MNHRNHSNTQLQPVLTNAQPTSINSSLNGPEDTPHFRRQVL